MTSGAAEVVAPALDDEALVVAPPADELVSSIFPPEQPATANVKSEPMRSATFTSTGPRSERDGREKRKKVIYPF